VGVKNLVVNRTVRVDWIGGMASVVIIIGCTSVQSLHVGALSRATGTSGSKKPCRE